MKKYIVVVSIITMVLALVNGCSTDDSYCCTSNDQCDPVNGTPASCTMATCGQCEPVEHSLEITMGDMPDAVLCSSFNVELTASGGIPPYTWELATGEVGKLGWLEFVQEGTNNEIARLRNKDGLYPSELTSGDGISLTITVKDYTRHGTDMKRVDDMGFVKQLKLKVVEGLSEPVFSPAPGTYNENQSITIAQRCPVAGAKIYFTTNGEDPSTSTSSTEYTAPISVKGHNTTTTIKAIAVKSGMLSSAIASGTYEIVYDAIVSHLAGPLGGPGNVDGIGSAARFDNPNGITSDGTNLYVADLSNYTIRKIVIATGEVTTIAGKAGSFGSTDGIGSVARFNSPRGITNDGANLYVCDSGNHTIRKIVIATGAVTTIAGSAGNSGSTDGIGLAARFYSSVGITNDSTSLYVTEGGNHTIRKIVISSGEVTTIAGTAGSSGSTDGIGSVARFSYPFGITTDGTNLYVADNGNHTIRKIVISTGEVTTLAGTAGSTGWTDGTGSVARFNTPKDITNDGINLYVAEYSNQTIRKIVISGGIVTTLAGMAQTSGSIDGTGSAARFKYPEGITNDGTNLYMTEFGNNTIRKIVISTEEVTTLAGLAGSEGSTDGTGKDASFYNPTSVTSDGTNLYVADTNNQIIRQIVISSGLVTTLAGSSVSSGSTDGTGAAATFKNPYGITTDGTNLYVADTGNNTIRKIEISGNVVTTLAGLAGNSGAIDGNCTSARFNGPNGITIDGTDIYVVERFSHTIRKIDISSSCIVTTLAGSPGSKGSTDGIGTAARFSDPGGITTDGTNLYVADTLNYAIRKIVISTVEVTTLAGSVGKIGSTDGVSSDARFRSPEGIATDGTNLFVTDTSNSTIRRIEIATGLVTTRAGTAGMKSSGDGLGLASYFNFPEGICYSGSSLFVTEAANNDIRRIDNP